MQKVPVNQFNGKYATAAKIHGKLGNSTTAGDNFGSWEYDQSDGSIHADDDYDENPQDGTPDHMNL
jgi:hypothetical protein